MGKIYNRAVDPQQYDPPDVGRTADIPGLGIPLRVHLLEYLYQYIVSWKGKDVLEIGSGVGWLLDLVHKAGARQIVGIDPSQKSVELARQYYPQLITISTTLENFRTKQNFDVVIAVLSVGHIADLGAFFFKIYQILRTSGELILVVTDFDYGKRSRYGYKIDYEKIDEESYIMAVHRAKGVISDIIRSVHKYQETGKKFNLCLTENIPMPPNKRINDKSSPLPRNEECSHDAAFKIL